MTIPLHIAEKLILLLGGQKLPASGMKHQATEKLITDGILLKQIKGRSKTMLYVQDSNMLKAYLKNQFGINDLIIYISTLKNTEATRSDAIEASSDSKLKNTRTFKGFPINYYQPLDAVLNGVSITVTPPNGTFIFIHDYDAFVPSPDITIVGIENPENFRYIEKQKALFKDIKPLFVSRYPQSRDLIKWLINISNPYLHFGDFDFAGINIYLNEYKKHLGGRASFLIPDNIEKHLRSFGNKALYDNQFLMQPDLANITEPRILSLISLLHKHKKGLEQEFFLI